MQNSAQEASGGTPLLTACVTKEVCRYQSPLKHKNELREGESSVGISRKVPLIPSRFQQAADQVTFLYTVIHGLPQGGWLCRRHLKWPDISKCKT